MSRNISDPLLEDLYALNSTAMELLVARIDDGTTITYLVRDTVDLTYNSQVYTALPFEITLPNDNEDESGSATLKVADPDGVVFTAIRTVDSLSVEFEIVHRTSAGTLTSISNFPNFLLTSARWDVSTATFTLERDDATQQTFPKDTMNNTLFPGIY